MKIRTFPFYMLVLLVLLLEACSPTTAQANPTFTAAVPVTQVSVTEPPMPVKTMTATFPPVPTATLTDTPIPSQTSTAEPTPSPIPTYSVLRGVVIPDKVSCRYGPGAMYLYLYGMVKGAVQDIVGRTDTGKWVLTRSHGDNKSCWVKTEFMDINGDVMSVEMVYPDKYKLPVSNQGYRLPWDVAAVRSGDKVTIDWKSEPLRAGDEESATSVLYVVETWVCQMGQLVFIPVGAYIPQVTVVDEPGCSQPSHGRVFFSEKHGYAGPTQILWPPAK
jgi:hypothetical protein